MALASSLCIGVDYPIKPVRMVVGFVAGGGTDVVARIIAPKLSDAWNEQVVIDNRAGATGTIAAGIVAHATADGYTLLMGHASSNTVAPQIYAKVPFDPLKDFEFVTLAGSVPQLISVHPSLPVRSITELITYAKAHPGELTTPSSGHGSMSHIAGEIFKQTTRTNIVHVPFKGAGQSVQALVAGQVKVSFDTTPAVLNFVRAGRLRPLAITVPRRVSSLPDVPTTAEAGIPDCTISSWYGVFAPAGTPAFIVRKINSDLNRTLDLPDAKERMQELGADELRTNTPEAFSAMVKQEIARYSKVIKAAGIRIE
jgi:tripartite-type tricarboxylate transporter receptor subunit TctC